MSVRSSFVELSGSSTCVALLPDAAKSCVVVMLNPSRSRVDRRSVQETSLTWPASSHCSPSSLDPKPFATLLPMIHAVHADCGCGWTGGGATGGGEAGSGPSGGAVGGDASGGGFGEKRQSFATTPSTLLSPLPLFGVRHPSAVPLPLVV